METNIYRPVYKNIENEFNELMFSIHIDDNQLDVYSSKISDLILRASTEIESISKELYKQNGGTKTGNIKYDEDAISYLDKIWNLENKVVIVSSYNCFLTNTKLYPFKKSEKRTGTNRLTFSRNNAYQNLKHDRANGLKFGSIKYLFDVTAALYILNICYKDLEFELGDNRTGSNFDNSLGSNIYSIKVHSFTINRQKFEECIYLIRPTKESSIKMNKAMTTAHQLNDIIKKKKSFESQNKGTKINHPTKNDNREDLWDHELERLGDLEFRAVLNKSKSRK